MIPKALNSFMTKLFQATSDDVLKWEEGSDTAYFTNHKDAEMHIRIFYDSDTGETGYNFRIIRGANDAFFTVISEEDDFIFMRNLYSVISVNAAGGKSIADGLFD